MGKVARVASGKVVRAASAPAEGRPPPLAALAATGAHLGLLSALAGIDGAFTRSDVVVVVALVAAGFAEERIRGSAALPPRSDAHDEESGELEDESPRLARALGFTWLVLALALLLVPGDPPLELEALGLLCTLGGLALRLAAIATLGPAFSDALAPRTAARVRRGPYRHLAHPAASGSLLFALGLVLGSGSLPAALVVGLGLTPLLVLRVRAEDRACARAWTTRP